MGDLPGAGSDPSGASRLRELVVEVLERMDEVGAGALEDACEEHPELAAALRARIDGLRELGLVGTPAGSHPERVGDFRLIETIGAGGMGVVYLAEQESLGREVALKLVRPDVLLQDDARERFARETSIVARLQHPGIVPIYTVGDEHELPWYAMERVAGCTLAEALAQLDAPAPDSLTGSDLQAAVCASAGLEAPERLPALFEGTWEETALRVVMQVADALAHAHGRGVLHRDLKPSNVMITPTGRVMLVDFGLSTSDGDDSLTGTTDRVGSLPYMPPELLRDGPRALDGRSDVYGLGVVLYELLTLHRPFEQEGVPGKMAAILEGRPPRPRSHAPGLGWETETVCLAAIEPDPDRRYASAEAFARDVENVLARRPIEARRASPALLLRRFCQRHPAVAVAAVLLVVLPSVAAVLLARAQQRALDNRDRALRAIDAMLVEVASERLDHVPRVHDLRVDLFARAGALYEEIARESPGDLEVVRKASDTNLQRIELLQRAGRLPDQESELRAIVADLEPFLDEGGTRVRRLHAAALLKLSLAVREPGRDGEGQALMDGALAGLEEVVAADPDDSDSAALRIHALLGNVIWDHRRGVVIDTDGRLVEAERAARTLVERDPDTGRAMLAEVLHKRADWLLQERSPAEALPLLEESVEHHRTVLASRPDEELVRFELSQTAFCLGAALAAFGRDDEAQAAFDVAATEIAGLVGDHPELPGFRAHVSRVALRRGIHAMEADRFEDAMELLETARAGFEEVRAELTSDDRVTLWLGMAVFHLSGGCLNLRQIDRAVQLHAEARALLEEAAAAEPDDPTRRHWLGLEHILRCNVLMRSYRFVEGAEALVAAAPLFEDGEPRLSELARKMADVLEVMDYLDADDPEQAEVIDTCQSLATRLDAKLVGRLPDDDPNVATLRRWMRQ